MINVLSERLINSSVNLKTKNDTINSNTEKCKINI